MIIINGYRKTIVSSAAILENVNFKYVHEEGRKILLEFFVIMLTGGNVDNIKNPKMLSLAKSLAQDVIYAVHRGRIKTSKHITLGMALKSSTSSGKVVTLLNHFGHCISYHGIEELETEATFTISNICPFGMVLNPDLHNGVAFDNFDRYVETRTGKGDTLHDTVGIVFQDCLPEQELARLANDASENFDIASEQQTDENTNNLKVGKRRCCRTTSLVLEPVTKKPRFCDTFTLSDQSVPNNFAEVERLDRLWMLSH